MIVPLTVLDLTLTLYQHICFRAYGIPRVQRRDYLVIDRHRLSYLNAVEKFNCAYCDYGNGLIGYAREIVARTEQYWCPTRHARRIPGTHERYKDFFHYGDAEAYAQGSAIKDKNSGHNGSYISGRLYQARYSYPSAGIGLAGCAIECSIGTEAFINWRASHGNHSN